MTLEYLSQSGTPSEAPKKWIIDLSQMMNSTAKQRLFLRPHSVPGGWIRQATRQR